MKDGNIKILIIRLSSIGDILLTTPFIRQTRRKFPNSKIDFVIKEEFAQLLDHNTNVNNLIKFNSKGGSYKLGELKKSLVENHYDYIFDLHNNFRSIYLRQGHKKSSVFRIEKNKIKQILYVKFKINNYTQVTPIAERYLNVGKNAGIIDDENGLEIFWDNNTKESVKQILEKQVINPNDQVIAIAPGAGFYTKRWPVENYKKFILNIMEKHHYKVVVLGNENDKLQGKVLAELENVIDLTGQLSLLQTAVVLSNSKALISNDTGLMHMATAVYTPVLAIFGSTVKEFGFYPYRSKSIVVEAEGLECRPCSHIGRHTCPKEHFKCMNDITPDIVFENFQRLIIKD